MRLVEVKRYRWSLISLAETSQISWSGKPWIGYTWREVTMVTRYIFYHFDVLKPFNVSVLLTGFGPGRTGLSHQNVLVDEEWVAWHLLKLPVWEVRLAVRDEAAHVVFPGNTATTDGHGEVRTGSEESECSASTPCDRELDEVQQLLGTVANRAGLVAVSTATDTPGETNMESPGEQSGWETKGPEPEKNWNQNRTRTKTRITAGTRARTKPEPEPEPQLNNQNYNKNRIRTESEQNSLLSLFQLLVLVLHQQMIPAEVRPALSSWWWDLACSVVMVKRSGLLCRHGDVKSKLYSLS